MGVIHDPIKLRDNIEILLRDRTSGRVVYRWSSHNVFLNQGRVWQSRLVVAAAFPGDDGNRNLTGNGGQSGNADTYSPIGKTYRPRYIGLGVGGTLQSVSPPGPGGQTEHAGVTRLERPVRVTSGAWLKQVLPNDDPNDPEQFDTYSPIIRGIFGYSDASYVGCVDTLGTVYNTAVPVSEVGLFTSEASAAGTPSSTGLIAYHQFPPITKTPNVILEVRWRLES